MATVVFLFLVVWEWKPAIKSKKKKKKKKKEKGKMTGNSVFWIGTYLTFQATSTQQDFVPLMDSFQNFRRAPQSI